MIYAVCCYCRSLEPYQIHFHKKSLVLKSLKFSMKTIKRFFSPNSDGICKLLDFCLRIISMYCFPPFSSLGNLRAKWRWALPLYWPKCCEPYATDFRLHALWGQSTLHFVPWHSPRRGEEPMWMWRRIRDLRGEREGCERERESLVAPKGRQS